VITRGGEELKVVIEREGQRIDLAIVPKIQEEPDGFGGKMRIGLLGVRHNPDGAIRYERMGPVAAVESGVERTWFIIDATFRYLGKLVTGRESADQLGGPSPWRRQPAMPPRSASSSSSASSHFCRSV
jgi:regulator of sigma E protease